ncbi:MAG: DUF547 domain-containing protein [Planctomycetota bacterium JB042]
MRSSLPFLVLASLVACGVSPASGSPNQEEEGAPAPAVRRMVAFDHAPFDAILRAVVRDERVDYAAVRKNHLPALDAYLDRIAPFDRALLPPRDRLAFDLNLYNATMIRAVVERLEADPDWTPAHDDFAVFREPLVRVGGRTITLNALENDVIRPESDEPRVHVALVCAAVSCPPLLPRAYVPGDLEETLDANMRRFLTDGKRNRIDRDAERLALSRIFEWYADDFGGRARLAEFVDRYVEGDVGDFEVTFLEYDWSLNALRTASGREEE